MRDRTVNIGAPCLRVDSGSLPIALSLCLYQEEHQSPLKRRQHLSGDGSRATVPQFIYIQYVQYMNAIRLYREYRCQLSLHDGSRGPVPLISCVDQISDRFGDRTWVVVPTDNTATSQESWHDSSPRTHWTRVHSTTPQWPTPSLRLDRNTL